MRRVGVIQNQSESLRSGYADVARNLETYLKLSEYEFLRFDGGNIDTLFTTDGSGLNSLDALFISTNATSDEKTRRSLIEHKEDIASFLAAGKGAFLSYQKKMSRKSGVDRRADQEILPGDFAVAMVERPDAEKDSGEGSVSIAVGTGRTTAGQYLVLNSPNVVTEQLVMAHCLENDFKRHVYRCHLVPENASAFAAVLEDNSYAGQPRRLLMVNRSAPNDERLVVSAIALDWENHVRLLTNIVTYIAEGAPRLALMESPGDQEDGFEFVESTVKLMGIPMRTYSNLRAPQGEMQRIHDVYVVASGWPAADVNQLWRQVSGESGVVIRPAHEFKRLYHLGRRAEGSASMTRYVNYTAIDIVVNQAMLWLESQYSGGFWAGGFWNSHDVLLMMVACDIDVSPYLPGVLADMRGHMRDGPYDAVMGPTCGALTLLNRLSVGYSELLEEAGFDIEKRATIVKWILANIDNQSDVARQEASLAVFSRGGEDVLDSLVGDERVSLTHLGGIVRIGVNVSPSRIASLGEMDLIRLLELAVASASLEQVATNVIEELVRRQGATGAWGSTGRTASITVALLESVPSDPEGVLYQGANGAIFRAIEAIRGAYDAETFSWGRVVQDTAMCVHALALYNRLQNVSGQEIFDTVEADTRLARRSMNTGQARVDLEELFAREVSRTRELVSLRETVRDHQDEVEHLRASLASSERTAAWFGRLGTVSTLILVALVASLAISQRAALGAVLTSAGSVLGLVVGALIAVPITLWLAPRDRP